VSANLRSAFLIGSGVLVDATTGANIADTRIRAIHATGSGTYVLDGTSVTPLGSTAGQKISFGVYLSDIGIRVDGVVSVTAPASASTITVFYG